MAADQPQDTRSAAKGRDDWTLMEGDSLGEWLATTHFSG